MRPLTMALLLASLAALPASAAFTSLGGLSDGPQIDGGILERVPDGTMGPLPPTQCWASQCEQKQGEKAQASAFNAASSMSPDGTPWLSPTCTRIPCRTVGTGAGPGPGAANAVPPGEKTVVTTPNGTLVCDLQDCRAPTPDELARAAAQEREAKEREKAANKGFDSTGGFAGTTPAPKPDPVSAAAAGDGTLPGDGAADRTDPADVADMFSGLIADNGGAAGTDPGAGAEAPNGGRQAPRTAKIDMPALMNSTAGWDRLNRAEDTVQRYIRGSGGQFDPGRSPALEATPAACEAGTVCTGTNDLR